MSEKVAKAKGVKPKTKKLDSRVRRTRNALGDALVALMHEKPFEKITVQHVLDRAEVSRSTFYSHFSDKNDLFLSDMEDFLDMMAFALSRNKSKSERVAPVRELFEHVAEWREFHDVLIKADKIRDFMELGQGHFARGIEQRLGEISRSHHLDPATRTALSQMFAGALMSLLSSWIVDRKGPSPEEMDKLYHTMVWKGISVG